MKKFKLMPALSEYENLAAFAADAQLGADDLVFTNEKLYHTLIEPLHTGCQAVFREKHGTGEPTDLMVDSILAEVNPLSFRRLIAIGGGTIIDISKLLAVAAADDTTESIFARGAEQHKKCELVIIPTTCGTGSEVTGISIVSLTKLGTKLGLVSPALFADEAVLIPALLDTIPYDVFATSSIDAMVHAVEAFLSPIANDISELFSCKALQIILSGWVGVVGDQSDLHRLQKKFLWASTYAGIAFGHAGCAGVHALSYPLSNAHHIAHGKSNQMMFASVMKKYAELAPNGKLLALQDIIGSVLGCGREEAMEALFALMEKILPAESLSHAGVARDELPHYRDIVMNSQQRLMANNYVPLSAEQVLDIYEKAF